MAEYREWRLPITLLGASRALKLGWRGTGADVAFNAPVRGGNLC